MNEKDEKVLAILDEIEAEMKNIGYWNPNPPEVKVDNYLQAQTFELWLQCVFLPNAREAARSGEYPANSQVGTIALRQYDYQSHVQEAQHLVALLFDFDKLVVGG